MRHHALACDDDGTIAHDGKVEGDTAEDARRRHGDDPGRSRARIREAIQQRYTTPT